MATVDKPTARDTGLRDTPSARGEPAPAPEAADVSALDRYRPELLAHCYRMLGSVHDAEDLVQETYLRAWKSQDTFEGRSSMRTWLYRIATNACLTALQSRGRRPLPTGLGQEAADPYDTVVQQPEVPWLEPMPDALVSDLPDDPASVVTSRESIRLAFVAALQNLPPRQRAVLVLREVLAWRASEVAEALGTSTAAVNSMLQRARAQLDQVHLSRDDVVEPDEPERRALLDRYVAAFEDYDVDAIVSMFTEDAIWEMPPFTGWYQGAGAIGNLISSQCPASGPADMRMLRADANGQPAFALYMRDTDGVHRAFQIQVLTLENGAVSHVGCFFDTGLFRAFGLPDVYPGVSTRPSSARSPWGGVELLERAVGYTRGSLALVTPALMPAPTPCAGWDLETLLAHLLDSLTSLHEAGWVRRVRIDVTGPAPADLVGTLRTRACQLLAEWSVQWHEAPGLDPRHPSRTPDVLVDGRPLTPRVLTSAGALEVAVHGWDVAVACGVRRPIPDALASDLMRVAPVLVSSADRPARFGPPLSPSPGASASERLLAFLGRRP